MGVCILLGVFIGGGLIVGVVWGCFCVFFCLV